MIEREILEKVYSNIFEREDRDYFYSGFPDLDEILTNVPKGSLITIGGRPSMGKTALITSIIENIVKTGKKALLITLKDNKIRITTKLLKQFAEIKHPICNLQSLKTNDIVKLTEVFNDFFGYEIYLSDNSYTIDEIEKVIKNIQANYIFIDDLQLIKTDTKISKTEELNNVVLRLKDIAIEYDSYIILTSQLSRNVDSRKNYSPKLCDIKETDILEWISDLVIFIHRADYYNLEKLESKNIAELHIAKNNYGAQCSIILSFDSRIPKFYSSNLYLE